MGEPRKQFTFYRSYYDAIQGLPKKDRSAIILAICAYAIYETEPVGLSAAASTAFELIRPTLDSARMKADSGKQGGSKPKANRKQTEREKEGEKEKEKENEKEIEGFALLWDAYPVIRRGSRVVAFEAFREQILSQEDLNGALCALEAWKRSEQWAKDGGQYVPYLCNWLERGIWRSMPPDALPRERGLDDDEQDAIRRMMEEEL